MLFTFPWIHGKVLSAPTAQKLFFFNNCNNHFGDICTKGLLIK
ncbi:hypothetical protein FORC085_509 [Bacillus cereus]|nr:hypothetical protein FORC24_0469 [Bacillus cereus]QBZ23580.1 hypothetical protein FORC085_509 [Bacillus cereus]